MIGKSGLTNPSLTGSMEVAIYIVLVCQVPCIWLLLATQGSLENLLRKQKTKFTHNFKPNIYSLQVTGQILSPTNLPAIVLQVLTLGIPFFFGGGHSKGMGIGHNNLVISQVMGPHRLNLQRTSLPSLCI